MSGEVAVSPAAMGGDTAAAPARPVGVAELAGADGPKQPAQAQAGNKRANGNAVASLDAGLDGYLVREDSILQKQGSDNPGKKKRRRRKKSKSQSLRPEQESRDSPAAPEAHTEHLMQYTCNLLKAQALDFEVRGRELEEKNTAQALEIEAWEAKVRAVKRRLHNLQYDEAAMASASLPSIHTTNKAADAGAASSAASRDATDSLLPAKVAQMEGKVQQLLRERSQRLAEFAQSLPRDFVETLEQQIARLADVDRR